VLRPRGGLAVISTHWWETSPALPQPVVELLREPFHRTSDQRRPPFQNAFEDSPFEPLRSERFEEEITVDADRLLALYSTTSALAALASEERTALLFEARRHLDGSYHLPIPNAGPSDQPLFASASPLSGCIPERWPTLCLATLGVKKWDAALSAATSAEGPRPRLHPVVRRRA
jgi:hypothetical protein